MSTRAMIVVAAGSSDRFGSDKSLAAVAGAPLISHTISAVAGLVDICVLVCRADRQAVIESMDLGVIVVPGGSTRTASEMGGLAALGGEPDLIGIHDGARPLIDGELVDSLFAIAEEFGGAVPVLEPDQLLLDRNTHRPLRNAVKVQTPQVFTGPELLAAYVSAAQAGFDGHDTLEIMHRFSNVPVRAVTGDPRNIKVTYPQDLALVKASLEGPSHIEPR